MLYIYTYMHIYIYAYIHICIYTYIHIYIFKYISIHKQKSIYAVSFSYPNTLAQHESAPLNTTRAQALTFQKGLVCVCMKYVNIFVEYVNTHGGLLCVCPQYFNIHVMRRYTKWHRLPQIAFLFS